jgi:type I restriction-modification system DNA methylase subunit
MAEVPSRIIEIVETFERNIDEYKSQYNETQLRREFLDPFFEELGWDVSNKQGYAPAYKDVIHEDAIKIGGYTKAPDYCFRIGGTRKFFLEAKKPSIDVKHDAHPAYQLRRYAWSAKLPLSILTDFEEFAVYDCRNRPKQTDRAATARIMYLTYKEYADHWDEIAGIFSREAILKGSFDKYAVETKGKRGTSTVDKEFLSEIEKWRQWLAKNIALRNRQLSRDEINFSVQRTIDRILFLRMCEDRGIEHYSQLLSLTNADEVYQRLCVIFRKADSKYNSGLFHFEKEKDRHEPPDELTPNINIDDSHLRLILNSLYYPQCPYEFSVLPAEILGNVYEQFLGKVIELTASHQAKITDKPEVKKAGGVYYTPFYIVDYIVKNTVGKLCQGKSPVQISKIKILDPACGSGSFLLGAYTCLLDYHRDWYVENNPEKHTKKIYQGRGGLWFLTIAEKKRILLAHIFGVDIDSQAVEVTKLSLLLKVLEGETAETVGQTYKMFHERALPDLGDNIKCGNSLISPDFFDNPNIDSSDQELVRKINAFDWQKEFPQIFSRKNPGFDAVIGNPPYVRIQSLKETQPEAVLYFTSNYQSAVKGNYDIYVVFVEKGLDLLNTTGCLGFILPHKFFNAQYGQSLRVLIARAENLSQVVHFGHQQVFAGATTYTCLLFLEHPPQKKFKFVKVDNLLEWSSTGKAPERAIQSKNLKDEKWNFVLGSDAALFEKLKSMPTKLSNLTRIFVGTQTSADSIFVLKNCHLDGNYIVGTCAVTNKDVRVEAESVKPFLQGKSIRRYQPVSADNYLICPYIIRKDDYNLISEEQLSTKYPLAYDYLKSHRSLLCAREKGKFKGSDWFAFGYPKSMTLFQVTKLIVPDYNNMPSFTFDNSGHFYKTGYGIVLLDGVQESLFYLLGLLNTRLLFQYLRHIGTVLRGGYLRFWRQFIEQLPIRTIDFDNPEEKRMHNKMVSLVDTMLGLHKKLYSAKVPSEKTKIQRQIDATDKKIDQLVYELYSLTEEEIKIIEESTK